MTWPDWNFFCGFKDAQHAYPLCNSLLHKALVCFELKENGFKLTHDKGLLEKYLATGEVVYWSEDKNDRLYLPVFFLGTKTPEVVARYLKAVKKQDSDGLRKDPFRFIPFKK